MDENPNNDVNTQTEQTTDGGSSPAEQTPAQGAETTPENSETPVQSAGDKTVPYDRFKEVNEGFRQTQQELADIKARLALQPSPVQPQQPVAPEVAQAKQQLAQMMKEAGFVSKEEMQEQQAQQQAVAAVGTEHSRLAGKYAGTDGLPKYDAKAVQDYAIKMGFTKPEHLEIAYKQMNEAAVMEARINKAMQQTRGIQTETSNGTGSANTGVSNDDLQKAAQEGDKNAVHLLLKRRLSGK